MALIEQIIRFATYTERQCPLWGPACHVTSALDAPEASRVEPWM